MDAGGGGSAAADEVVGATAATDDACLAGDAGSLAALPRGGSRGVASHWKCGDVTPPFALSEFEFEAFSCADDNGDNSGSVNMGNGEASMAADETMDDEEDCSSVGERFWDDSDEEDDAGCAKSEGRSMCDESASPTKDESRTPSSSVSPANERSV